MNLLKFSYVNHNNQFHTYKVIPVDVRFDRCKCFPGQPEKKAWIMECIVLERSGEERHVRRSFALVKMEDVEEVAISA